MRVLHQQVYPAIRDMVPAGHHADPLTVVQQLRPRGTLARTEGPTLWLA
ncbi:MAG: DnaB-like helicase N-terminal domain-containing protein [Janthinobacterium lividum]